MRKKWIVAITAMLVLSVLACSFSVDLGLPTEPVPPQTPTPSPEPSAVSEPASSTRIASPTPARRVPSAGTRYVECVREILDAIKALDDDMHLVMSLGDYNAVVYCQYWDGSYAQRATDQVREHSACPMPESECLQEGRRLIGLSLDETLLSYGAVDTFCGRLDGGEFDPSLTLLFEVRDHYKRAVLYLNQANTALEECEW